MTSTSVLSSLDARGIATVVLNRPEVGNAYNGELIEALLAGLSHCFLLTLSGGLKSLLSAGIPTAAGSP